MRVKWCGGPGARALILGLLMGQLCLAMTLPVFARPSPSSAFSGLLHAKNFRATFENRPLSMAPLTGDPADSYALVPSLEGYPQRAPLRPALLETHDPCHAGPLDPVVGGAADEAVTTLSILDQWGLKTRTAPSISVVPYTLAENPFIVPVSLYACFAFSPGTMPKSAERGFPRITHQPCGEASSTNSFSRLPSDAEKGVLKSMTGAVALSGAAEEPVGEAPVATVATIAEMAVSLWDEVSSMKFVSHLAMLAVLYHGKIPVIAFLLSYGVLVDATVCPHCKDTILPAGHGATACPLIAELNANAVIFTTKKLGTSPTVVHSMTHELAMHFTRPVIDAIVGLACAPTQGTSIDFTDAAYTQASSVVKAAVYGHCSFAEASSVLSERLDAAATTLDVEKIRGAMDTLKSASESAVNSATGTFMFIWAKVSNVISKRADFTFKLEAAGKAKASSHSVTLVRPETEAEFYEMTFLFMMTIIALGIASAPIVMKFIDDVVYGTIRMKDPFQVAHELVILYYREMDHDPARLLHMGNVFRRGGQDTLLSEARRNAAAFFRTCGANPRVLKGATDVKTEYSKPDAKPNGKDDSSSKKPCPDFNAGRPCKKLKPDGTCVFAHRCNQFVSDKGPGGYCFAAHARCTGCDYDAAKKLRAPAA